MVIFSPREVSTSSLCMVLDVRYSPASKREVVIGHAEHVEGWCAPEVSPRLRNEREMHTKL
jgi:hypothetical protein